MPSSTAGTRCLKVVIQGLLEESKYPSRCSALPGNKGAIGRTLRRFLARHVEGHNVFQCFAYSQSLPETQVEVVRFVAAVVDDEQQLALHEEVDGASYAFHGVVSDATSGLVANCYSVVPSLENASVAQMREMLKLVIVLADGLIDICSRGFRPMSSAQAPEYGFRTHLVTEEQSWVVSGSENGADEVVLEYCISETDAFEVATCLAHFPERFKQVRTESYAHLCERALEATTA